MPSNSRGHGSNSCSNGHSNEGLSVDNHSAWGATNGCVSRCVSLGVGIALSLGLAQSASAVTFRTDWTGQISGYRAEGVFSYDDDQAYADGIVRRDDLTNFDISFYDPTGSLLKTFEDNHLTYDGFNFNFNTRTQEILQDGFFNEANGIDIGEYIPTFDDAGEVVSVTGLNFWSAAPAPDGEPIPHVHLTDFGSEFPDPPIAFGSHLDVAFFTRTRGQLLDDSSAGDQFGEKMSATKVPEPGLLLGMGAIALLAARLHRKPGAIDSV